MSGRGTGLMQKKITTLLKDLSEKTKQYTSDDFAESSPFNIFSVLGVESKEVIICRFLGELLDPNGSHQMGGWPLRCFAEQVLRAESFSEEDAQQAYICLEERIDDNRRVDIVIHSGNSVFPLEVKIWAGDQDSQLYDYYRYYKKHYQISAICYLTPSGWPPSKQSKGDLADNQIICRSFTKDICKWLEHILFACDNKEVCVFIKQFIEVIKKMEINNEQMQMLMDTLNLNENEELNLETINAALLLLTHKNELQKTIWRKYIRKILTCETGFELVDCEESDLVVDKYTLLRVNWYGNPVAWICVQQNLYVYCKKTKDSTQNYWHGTADGGYRWTHISPKGKKTYPIRDMSNLRDVEINITSILQDIDGIELKTTNYQ